MSKVTIPPISGGYLSSDALNSALVALVAALENTVSRDGSIPNTMSAPLDMNSNSIINVKTAVLPGDAVPFSQLGSYVDGKASGYVKQKIERITATAAQTLFILTTMTYVALSNNLAVYVNGIRKFATYDYTETSSTSVTFLAGLTAGDKVQFVTNEFLGTIILPAHTHPWVDITGAPLYTTRWPTWSEVISKPTTFTPSAHVHDAIDIATGRLVDARRGVYVQAGAPTAVTVGELWFY